MGNGSVEKLTCPEWRSVIGYEGLYEVSDDGQVRSLGAQSTWSRWKYYKGGPLKPTKTKRGYLQVALRKDGSEKSVFVHKLVAEAFIGPRPDGMQICHWDDNKENNRLANLRYGVAQDNADDRVRNGRLRTRSTGHHAAKLSDADVQAILASSEKGVVLAERYGVSWSQISYVRIHVRAKLAASSA